MAVIPLPLTTILPGTPIVLPPTTVPAGVGKAVLAVNRKVGSNPLDAAPAVDVLELKFEFSGDGGTTWAVMGSATFPGGLQNSKLGGELLVNDLTINIWGSINDSTRQVRGTATAIGGVPTSVSGSLTV